MNEIIEELRFRFSDAKERASETAKIDLGSYGAGYDLGYHDALGELLEFAESNHIPAPAQPVVKQCPPVACTECGAAFGEACRASAHSSAPAQAPVDGHGYGGAFSATEFNERAWDHEKAAKNGLSAGPNVSYVRTFQACAVALRYAAKHMPFDPVASQVSSTEGK